jgi:hypothetical protein
MNTATMMYVIDKDYKILYVNEEFKKYYPDIVSGHICYEAFANKDKACSYCPYMKSDKESVFYNAKSGEWIKSQVAEIEWSGKPHCQAVFFKVWNGKQIENEQLENRDDQKVMEAVISDEAISREALSESDRMVEDLHKAQNELEMKNRVLERQNELLKYFSL